MKPPGEKERITRRARFGDYGLQDCWPVSSLVKAYRRRRSRRPLGRRRLPAAPEEKQQ